jgi:hypothetical protein
MDCNAPLNRLFLNFSKYKSIDGFSWSTYVEIFFEFKKNQNLFFFEIFSWKILIESLDLETIDKDCFSLNVLFEAIISVIKVKVLIKIKNLNYSF